MDRESVNQRPQQQAPDQGTAPARQVLQIGDNGLYVMRNQIDAMRVAEHLLNTGAVPQTLRVPEQVAMAVQSLNSLGLNPYAAIRQVGFINGAFTLWGDLPLALARKSGVLEDIEEFRFTVDAKGNYLRQCFENSNAHLETFGAVCRVKRLDQTTHEVVFTQADAKRSGLWGKTPTWRNYPARMMQMRARSQALKDIFSDALAGVQIREFDLEGTGVKTVSTLPAGTKNPPYAAMFGLDAIGLTVADLEDYLGHDIESSEHNEIELLRSVTASVRAKKITWADALAARKARYQPPSLSTPAVTRRRGRPPRQQPGPAMAADEAQQADDLDAAAGPHFDDDPVLHNLEGPHEDDDEAGYGQAGAPEAKLSRTQRLARHLNAVPARRSR